MSPFHRLVNRGSEKLLHVPEATQPARGSPGTRTQGFLTRLGTVGWREPAVEALGSANQTALGRDGGSGSMGDTQCETPNDKCQDGNSLWVAGLLQA